MGTQPVPSETEFRLDQLFRSETLVVIREFLELSPELRRLFEHRVVQIQAIVDANIVQGELRWRLGSRIKSQARSGLEEALDAGVMVLIAPEFLKIEIQKYLPAIAEQTGASLHQAEAEWEIFQSKLYFYQPPSRASDGFVADPKDLPYKNASDDLALPIYTRDPDLAKMNAPVLWVRIDTTCRDHARATSITLGATLGSGFSVSIGAGALRAALQGIKNIVGDFRQLPGWLQVAITGALAVIAIHPKSRAKLLQFWTSISTITRDARKPLLEGLVTVMQQIAAAQSEADRTMQEILQALPSAKSAPALVRARRICVTSRKPVPIGEITRRMRNEGYTTRAKNFEAYLRRILRTSGEFIEVSRGVWKLRSA